MERAMKTLEQRIEEIEKVANLYYKDSMFESKIPIARMAISIIKELQQENKQLKEQLRNNGRDNKF